VEPHCLPDTKFFFFQLYLYPMKILHPRIITPLHVGECRGDLLDYREGG
jgi:hypothetical protein